METLLIAAGIGVISALVALFGGCWLLQWLGIEDLFIEEEY